MNNTNLPPLPPPNAIGPEFCAIIHLYLAVWHDLTPAEALKVAEHVKICANCTQEQRIVMRSSQLVALLESSEPSAKVDQAVMSAIAERSRAPRPVGQFRRRPRKSPFHFSALVALAAVLLLTILTSAYFWLSPPQSTFALPANLSWNSYVLYHTQTMTTAQGEHYQILSYHNMSSKTINVETVMDDTLDVVAVGNQQKGLGLDMMHHVAQWDAHDWLVDESIFDLTRLRSDLQNHQAVYQGKDHFKGQDVYRIRYPDGKILLLDMHYMPVNVLEKAGASSGGTPMYDTLRWFRPSQVPGSMWDMQVPQGFIMSQLPARP